MWRVPGKVIPFKIQASDGYWFSLYSESTSGRECRTFGNLCADKNERNETWEDLKTRKTILKPSLFQRKLRSAITGVVCELDLLQIGIQAAKI